MEYTPIAQLSPELPDLELRQFKAVVTLIWPYSSSTRQCAVLLAESDFRLRRRRGQVRVRFCGSSAKAFAGTGVGIGDEIVLSLQGAQFVHEDATVSTPGRSIDWELSFSQTAIAQISRAGNEVANLDFVNAAPTPAARSPVRQASPVRRQPTATPLKGADLLPGEPNRWSSPAFLKRARLSDGPFFQAGYDPLVRESEDGHDKKRRRKSYRDWKAWTYSARTPSPEKDGLETDEEYDDVLASPLRSAQLPATPISPPKPELYSVAGLPLESRSETENTPGDTDEDRVAEYNIHAAHVQKHPDDFVRDADYYNLYAGPDEEPPDMTHAYGGDTEPNTDAEEFELTQGKKRGPVSAESDEDHGPDLPEEGKDETDVHPSSERGAAEEEAVPTHAENVSCSEEARRIRERSGTQDDPILLDEAPQIVMPPPILPSLQTNVQPAAALAPGLLTPIGKEPQSPVILPLDSSTLPMPSPFPGERDGSALSYLDAATSSQQLAQLTSAASHDRQQDEEPSSEASFIVESSFYGSVGPSNTQTYHTTHESAFTDVRFTFGMDGSAISRPREAPKSPTTEELDVEDADAELREMDTGESGLHAELEFQEQVAEQQTSDIFDQYADHDAYSKDQQSTPTHRDIEGLEEVSQQPPLSVPQQRSETDVIMLSSDTESENDENEPPSTKEQDNADQYSSKTRDDMDLESISHPDDATFDDDLVNTAGELPIADDVGLAHPLPSLLGEADDIPHHESRTVPMADELVPNDQSASINEEMEDTDRSAIRLNSRRQSQAFAEIIDLGSGSDESDESDEGENTQTQTLPTARDALIEGRRTLNSPDAAQIHKEHETVPRTSESTMHELFRDTSAFAVASQDVIETSAREDIEQAGNARTRHYEDAADFLSDNDRPQIHMQGLDETMHDDIATQDSPVEFPETLDRHSDIKLESIEEDTPFQLSQMHSSTQDDDEESIAGPSADLLIEIPEDGHKVGELQKIAVAATGPARNTRSKTKTSMSPVKDDTPAPPTKARSTRSKTSMASTARTTQSPVKPRFRSTLSPMQDTIPESSYRLHSQSKVLSPSKATGIALETRSSRRERHSKQRLDGSSSPPREPSSQQGSSQFDPTEFPETYYEPSQELGASQGKLSDVPFVRDSEEGSLHSEHSLSTVLYSDDYDQFGYRPHDDLSDPAEIAAHVTETDTVLAKPPFASRSPALEPPEQVEAATRKRSLPNHHLHRTDPTPRPLSYSPIIPARFPSSGGLRKTTDPSGKTGSSPPKSQASRRGTYEPRQSPEAVAEDESSGETTPRARQIEEEVIYPGLPLDDDTRLRSSLPLTGSGALREEVESPTVVEPEQAPASVNQPSIANSNLPITPDATQQTLASQPTLFTSRPEQSLPLTPQLTQTTSVGLRGESFNTDMEMEEAPHEPLVKPFAVLATTPRRNVTEADVASREASPSVHSEDLSEDSDTETQLAKATDPPSIGLSTPMAYYTPLKDLPYFLNRSSQFHSSANPDILALVTSSTTPPKRAEKGPKHWNTTCHITDLSIFPEPRTVQIFRAYNTALPIAQKGDIILLRGFQVKSLNRKPSLLSGDESAWCVWRWSKPIWGKKKGAFGEVKAREEVKGPVVEKGEGEYREVERLRAWWVGTVKRALEEVEREREGREVRTRSKDKAMSNGVGASQVET